MKPELVEPDYKRWDSGDVVGRYTLLTRIAVGGMAEIWLARQKGLEGFEKVVVIKRIADAYSSDTTFVEMFLDEARIAAQLDHPNIVQIHDLGEHRGAYFIAMEYLNGEDLAMTVRTGAKTGERLPFSLAAQIISHAAEGLASAHQKVGLDGKPLSIVHRDVSPQNIFVTYEGVVKVLDFGVAKAANRASHTQGGQLKGKFGYMAPEQARGDDVDGRADVWSLGVVLFEAVTVSRLWDPKADPQRIMRQLLSDDAIPLARSRDPHVPSELEDVISKALARDALHRYQSANELKAALDRWLHSGKDTTSTSDLGAYMRKIFAERIGRKSALIESARSGEIKFFKVPEALKPETENSMPGDTVLVTGEKRALARRSPIVLMAGLGLFAAGLVLAAVVKLSATSGSPPILEVDTVPGGARLEIDGVDVGVAPLRSTLLKPGKHVVLAMLEGRQEQAKTVTLSDGTLTSVSLKFPEPAVAVPEPSPPQVAVVDEPEPIENPPEKVPGKPAAAARGKLSVDTNPWSHVFLDGKKLGDTPLINHPVAAGKHKLKLVNDEKGLSKVVDVNIAAGKTTVQKLELK